MIKLTCLPKNVYNWLQVLKPMFRERHFLVFAWIVVSQATSQETTLKGLSRVAASHVKEWHFRRLLKASYWYSKAILWWFADHAMKALPESEDGICYLIFDSSIKEKCGKKNPVVKKKRLNSFSPFVFGVEFVIAILHWGNYRIPIDFEIVRKKDDENYRKPNSLTRWMLVRFVPPSWAYTVVVVADSAFASQKNLRLIKKRGYIYVMALARTWCFEDGKSLKDLVKHLPKKYYRKSWIIDNKGRRRVYWTYSKRVCLRHLGEVTIVLSKKRRNDGPKKTKVIATNLPNAKNKQVVAIYARRWWVEIVIKELKSVIGLGRHQVTKDIASTEKSFAISFIAYLTIIKFQACDIPKKGSWGIFTLKNNFTLKIFKEHVENSTKQRLVKSLAC